MRFFDIKKFVEFNHLWHGTDGQENEAVNILHLPTTNDKEEFLQILKDKNIENNFKQNDTATYFRFSFRSSSLLVNAGNEHTYEGCNIYTLSKAHEIFGDGKNKLFDLLMDD